MLNSRKQEQFGKIKSKYPMKCQRCRWLNYCFGGCPKDRIRDPEDKGISHFCKAYKMFFEHADSRLKELAADWEKNN